MIVPIASRLRGQSPDSKAAVPSPGADADLELPPFPRVATALLNLTVRDDVGLAEVTEILSADAATSAELLRIANAAFVGVRGEVDGVVQAAAILGMKRISALASTLAIRGFVARFMNTIAVRRCWYHNLATALSAETIARTLNLDPHVAYTCGLLHDIGRLGLIVKHQGSYILLLNQHRPHLHDGSTDIRVIERERFGMDHGAAGEQLVSRLELPPVFAHVAAHHHDDPSERRATIPNVVRAACRFATAIGYGAFDVGVSVPDPIDPLFDALPEGQAELLARDREYLIETVVRLIDAYDRALP